MWIKGASGDGVWVVGVDVGDRDGWMDSSFPGREAEFDGSRGYNLFDLKRAEPLVIQLLGQMGGHIVLGIQPYLSSDFVDRCRAPPTIIVSCHLICCMFKSSFHLLLHLRHLLGEVVCSFYSRTLRGL